jgi:hypothetical protein
LKTSPVVNLNLLPVSPKKEAGRPLRRKRMEKKHALALLYEALQSCEGIPEVTDLGISPLQVLEVMDERELVAEDMGDHTTNVVAAMDSLRECLVCRECLV